MISLAFFLVSLYFGHGYRNQLGSVCLRRSQSILLSSRSGMKASSKAPSEVFFCDQCGVEHIKWVGRCTSCKEWNTVKPFKAAKLSNIGLDPRLRSAPALNSIKGLISGSDLTTKSSTYSSWLGSSGSGIGSSSVSGSLIPMENVDLNVSTYRLKLFRYQFWASHCYSSMNENKIL